MSITCMNLTILPVTGLAVGVQPAAASCLWQGQRQAALAGYAGVRQIEMRSVDVMKRFWLEAAQVVALGSAALYLWGLSYAIGYYQGLGISPGLLEKDLSYVMATGFLAIPSVPVGCWPDCLTFYGAGVVLIILIRKTRGDTRRWLYAAWLAGFIIIHGFLTFESARLSAMHKIERIDCFYSSKVDVPPERFLEVSYVDSCDSNPTRVAGFELVQAGKYLIICARDARIAIPHRAISSIKYVREPREDAEYWSQ